MGENICPNINSCRMLTTDMVVPDSIEKEKLMASWCRQGEETWSNCKRYKTKKILSFCPDFVVPSTDLTVDEIIDKFEVANQD